jgi:hypothetical protein
VGRESRPVLARELQHRLKNNLQFVLSLLAFQADRVRDPVTLVEFARFESRIRAVARLHESAYASVDFSVIEFGAYLRHLVRDLSIGNATAVQVEAAEVAVPIDNAVPLALIAHELVRAGLDESESSEQMSVVLSYAAENALRLQIENVSTNTQDGPNFCDGDLVALLVEQLQGSLESKTANGQSTVAVSFSINED